MKQELALTDPAAAQEFLDPGGAQLKVVVTMPAYHAAGTLQQTLDDLPTALHEHVVLVDDASTDGTIEVARNLGLTVVSHQQNRGYGATKRPAIRPRSPRVPTSW